LEHAVPGSFIMKIQNPKDSEEIDDARYEVQAGLDALENLEKSEVGVYIVASTLGSLEALFGFVRDEVKVPVCGISIGTVRRKDVMKTCVMLEKKPEYAVILAFDVAIAPDAFDLADSEGVQIMTADIIYHLQTQFQEYIDLVKAEQKANVAEDAVFPVMLEMIPEKVFARKDPIILGVQVKRGSLRIGTPICALNRDTNETVFIGKVTSIEGDERKELQKADKGTEVAVRIDLTSENTTKIEYKRHFPADALLVSRISRKSIDTLKEFYRDELVPEDVKLLKILKKVFDIK